LLGHLERRRMGTVGSHFDFIRASWRLLRTI
jgi:hypothetical protein